MINDPNLVNVTLGQLLNAPNIIASSIVHDAIENGVGGKRNDQKVVKVKTDSILVSLHCYTDERFLEVLDDFESGRMKDCFLKEFSLIGVEVQGMRIEIMNMEEVNKTKEAIIRRYIHKIYMSLKAIK